MLSRISYDSYLSRERYLRKKQIKYAGYYKAQTEMHKLAVYKANTAYLLGLEEEKTNEKERQRDEK